MSKLSTFSIRTGLRMRPKPICQHSSESTNYSPLDGRATHPCRCVAAPSFPGCIEDYRTKKVICPHYQKPL